MMEESLSELWKMLSYFLIIAFFIVSAALAFVSITAQSKEALTLRQAKVATALALSKWETSPGNISSSLVSSSDLPEGSRVRVYLEDGTLVAEAERGKLRDPLSLKVPVCVDGQEGYLVLELSR